MAPIYEEVNLSQRRKDAKRRMEREWLRMRGVMDESFDREARLKPAAKGTLPGRVATGSSPCLTGAPAEARRGQRLRNAMRTGRRRSLMVRIRAEPLKCSRARWGGP